MTVVSLIFDVADDEQFNPSVLEDATNVECRISQNRRLYLC